MAVGSLLYNGLNVRFSGQDVQRGTFSHRHFVFHDQQSGEAIVPFNRWESAQGRLYVHNSHLSEFAVVGFEYGVSIADPEKTLTIWESQFGDFFNGAQVIFDTFVSSGESKWGLQSGLVVLLPHGYDGTGPEHSSCRLERFLQMCNAPYDPRQDFTPNWHIVHPTTPANYFHLLQRQMSRNFRRPLIVASPKTLLRLPAATSSIKEMLDSAVGFQPVIDDPRNVKGTLIDKVILCSGKFYYEIEKERRSRDLENFVIVRIEELCPLPTHELTAVLKKYGKVKDIVWCQEEHRNMGSYDYISPRLSSLLTRSQRLIYVGREVSAVPAAGYSQLHKAELAAIWDQLWR